MSDLIDVSPQHSLILCLPTTKVIPKEEQNSLFPYGHHLEFIYHLLENIMKYLPYTDLTSASQVNSTWNKIARSVMKQRRNSTWLCLYKGPNNLMLNKSSNYNYHNINFSMIMYNYKKIKLNRFVCVHKTNKTAERKTLLEYLEEEVLSSCRNYCILSSTMLYPVLCHTNVEGNNTWFSALTLPEISNLRIVQFICNLKQTEDIKTVLSENVKQEEKMKCLLLFTTGYPQTTLDNFLLTILERYPPNSVALCGGVTSGIKSQECRKTFSRNHILCIGFLEKEESKCAAYSIVINEEDDFESKITIFKRSITLHTNSFILKITCCGRIDRKTESLVLFKHFPNVPVSAMDVNGEFGWDKFEDNSTSEEDASATKKKRSFPNASHQYTTIIALITWDV